MTSKQVANLQSSGMRCLVAGYLPAGYTASEIEIVKATKRETGYYAITYSNKRKSTLTLQMASDGIGDVILMDEGDPKAYTYQKLQTPLLGKTALEIYVKGAERHFAMNWVDLGAKRVPRFVCLIGRNIRAAEGTKIAKSLRWLPRTRR